MKNISMTTTELIAEYYTDYHHSVYLYIYHKINSKEESKDLSQDVFLRLMEYNQMLRRDTVKYFIFTIARNLVTDYLRGYYRKQEMTSYMYDVAEYSNNETESGIIANDLLAHEMIKLRKLPLQRQKIYTLHRFENQSTADIAADLNLSHRTVENHLFISRKEIREYMQQCI